MGVLFVVGVPPDACGASSDRGWLRAAQPSSRAAGSWPGQVRLHRLREPALTIAPPLLAVVPPAVHFVRSNRAVAQGDGDAPLELPAAFTVPPPFGSDIGGAPLPSFQPPTHPQRPRSAF